MMNERPESRGRPSRAGVWRVLLPLCLLIPIPDVARAQSLEPRDDFNKGGRTSFQFLKIGVGARQVALGEASVALVRDVNAVFWNPANLAGIDGVEAAFSYTRWIGEMNYVGGAFGWRWGGAGLFALSVAALDYGDIPEALVLGTDLTKDTRTGDTFGGGDLLLGLSYAREFTDRLSIGVTLKYIREDLWDFSASNLAFDVGTNYRMGFKGLTLAMSAQNFSGSVDYLGELSDRVSGYDIPLVFRIGVASDVVGAENGIFDVGSAHRLTLSLEAINTNDYDERYHAGGEYVFGDLLALRGGYRFNYEEGNLSLGFGLSPALSGMEVRVDYAYVDFEFLDAPHRLTMTIAF